MALAINFFISQLCLFSLQFYLFSQLIFNKIYSVYIVLKRKEKTKLWNITCNSSKEMWEKKEAGFHHRIKKKSKGTYLHLQWSFSRCFYPKRIMQIMTFYLTFLTFFFLRILSYISSFWLFSIDALTDSWVQIVRHNLGRKELRKKGACFCHKKKKVIATFYLKSNFFL